MYMDIFRRLLTTGIASLSVLNIFIELRTDEIGRPWSPTFLQDLAPKEVAKEDEMPAL